MRTATALLSTALPLAAGGRVQLLPAGTFAARDGRPGKNLKWQVTDVNGPKLAAQLNAVNETNPTVIDYEHQTMLSAENGKPAPAAGWMTKVEWLSGQGLFTDVDWTPAAKQAIESGEYRFISPVIGYDKATGEIDAVHNAALTNYPALLGMKPVVARLTALYSSSDDEQEPDVDLSALLTQLGLAQGSTPEQIAAHINGLRSTVAAVAELRTSLGIGADKPLTEVVSAITSLRSSLDLSSTAPLADIGTAVAALRTKASTPDQATLSSMQALQARVVELETANLSTEIAGLVEDAVSQKKLLPSMREWATNLGKKDVASLRSFIAAAAPVAGLGGQSGGKGPGDAAAADTAALNVAAAMGVSPEAFAKAAPKAAA